MCPMSQSTMFAAADIGGSDLLEDFGKVLVVDDEASIRDPLGDYLTENGFEVTLAADAVEARAHLQRAPFHMIVLDVMMPGEDGFSLCRHIRETYDTPVVMLTARSEEIDRIIGLEIGADDYVPKPFNPRELLARVRAVLRRTNFHDAGETVAKATKLAFGDWVLNTQERALMDQDGVAVALSTGEYTLLHALLLRPHVVLTREQLLELTRGRVADVFDRSIDNMISRLRRKIEKDPKDPSIIKTVWGGGYIFAAEVEAQTSA